MLSRVANSLYWAGRYIERSDHIARYVNINYFSSLDAPNSISQSREFVLESILFMLGGEVNQKIEEEKALYRVGFDSDNPQSLLNTVVNARQNAHGTRHLLSTELWEAINKYYHFVNNYSPDVFVKTGLYDLTTKLNEMCSIIREKIIRTLLHDDVFALLMLGVYIERAFQSVRMINSKLYDVQKIIGQNPDIKAKDLTYEWATLLKCAEAFDMSKKYYKKMPDKTRTVDFLVLNKQNPKSLISSLSKVKEYVYRISNKDGQFDSDSVEFKAGKLLAHFQYFTIAEFESDLIGFLGKTLNNLYEIAECFERDYLSVNRNSQKQQQEQAQ